MTSSKYKETDKYIKNEIPLGGLVVKREMKRLRIKVEETSIIQMLIVSEKQEKR